MYCKDFLPVLDGHFTLTWPFPPSLPVQLRHIAHHHEVSPGELRSGPADRSLRAASGSYHQHGRDRPVRGSGGHLYRTGQWVWLGLWSAGHYQVRINTEFFVLTTSSFYTSNIAALVSSVLRQQRPASGQLEYLKQAWLPWWLSWPLWGCRLLTSRWLWPLIGFCESHKNDCTT